MSPRRIGSLSILLACSPAAPGDDGGSSSSTAASPTADGTASDEDDGASVSSAEGSDDAPNTDGTDDGSTDESSDTGDPVPPPTCGALENVPSEPGPHIAEIEALADDTWLPLGPPTADPQFGLGRGRSWGGRAFALASDLRGAFFTGEGVHAYVKPDGYGMDDFWFYDINAHAWITIHPGVDTMGFNQSVIDGALSIDDNGQLQDAFGNAVPLHVLIHAWDFVTYDTVAQRFVFLAGDGMGEYFMPGFELIEEGLGMLEAQRAGMTIPPMSPWYYSTANCAFERDPITTPLGVDFSTYGAFVYSSASDLFVYATAAGVWMFDKQANDWSLVEDSGARPVGYDHGVAYDPVRDRLYMGGGYGGEGSGVFVYDIATAAWTKTASSGEPAYFGPNAASAMYDNANDVITILHYSDGVHYTYDPNADTWTSQPLPAEVLEAVGYPSFNAFYDPVLNAYFVHAATDSEDNGTMWAYRWRN